MNKYPSNAHIEDKYTAARISTALKPKTMYCQTCERDTPHDGSRMGVRGLLWACRCCGSERTAK